MTPGTKVELVQSAKQKIVRKLLHMQYQVRTDTLTMNGNSAQVTTTRLMEGTLGMMRSDNGLYENSTIAVRMVNESHTIQS